MAKTEEGGRGIVFSFQFSVVRSRAWGTCDESHYYEQEGNPPCLLLGGIRVGNRSSLLQSRKESGLQSPPTRGFPPTKESGIGVPSYKVGKNRAYKALPQEGSPLPKSRESEFPPTKSERIGLTKPSHKRVSSYRRWVI